jgi:uncharacterized protein
VTHRALLLFLGAAAVASAAAAKEKPGVLDYPIHPVLFTDVRVHDGFWSKRLETNRAVSIPYAFRQCVETGRVGNFRLADSILTGKAATGSFCSRFGFDDSDVYKIIEGASYSLQTHFDAALDRYVDSLIETIGRAQESDGYLYTMRTINPGSSWAKERWVNDRTGGSHELYNLGHLYEAAVAHNRATGKSALLNIAVKSADLLVGTFGPDRMHTVPGHEVTEIGLAKLALATGRMEYLDLARFFIDERGHGTPPGESYNQDHVPVLEQSEALGHAVRAGYLYAGMADIAALTGDKRYVAAIDRIWEDVVRRKLYVTGGIGAAGSIEGFGAPYELPNISAYCETCAAIASVYWNHRMFLFHGDARYVDVIERVLYNGFLSGVGMSGDRFFYPNPLESLKGASRSPWFSCACCPSNVVRFLPSIPGYIYAQRDDTLYVNLFIGGESTIRMAGGAVSMRQKNDYPWNGSIGISVGPVRPRKFSLALRIPGWARNAPVPGDLYAYRDTVAESWSVTVNGKLVRVEVRDGFARLNRTWRRGDRVLLNLPMPVRRVAAHPNVVDDRGKTAFERGPVVFCLEGADNEGGRVSHLFIPDSVHVRATFNKELLGGVQVIGGSAFPTRRRIDGTIAVEKPVAFTAIPYYAWAHRGLHPMTVWAANDVSAVKPLPAPTLAYRSTLTTSGGTDAQALNDQLLPLHSNDHNVPYFHWWPKKGTLEWVQVDLPGTSVVSRVSVYWFDDTGTGECRVPSSWRILCREGGEWKPVRPDSPMEPAKDRDVTARFAPVTTDGIRIEVQLLPGYSAGMYEIRLD